MAIVADSLVKAGARIVSGPQTDTPKPRCPRRTERWST